MMISAFLAPTGFPSLLHRLPEGRPVVYPLLGKAGAVELFLRVGLAEGSRELVPPDHLPAFCAGAERLPEAAPSVTVGIANDRGQGADDNIWRNKCLQLSVVRLLPKRERASAQAYFKRACQNCFASGFVASLAERLNLLSVVRFLEQRSVFAWVYESVGEYAGCACALVPRAGDVWARCAGIRTKSM